MWWRSDKRHHAVAVACFLAAVVAAVTAPAGHGASGPPPGRGWELVSPAVKHGNDVVAESSRVRAAAHEAAGLPMAIAFASLGGFADVAGTGISTEYLAQRTGLPGTSGWTTHAITPPQQPLTIGAATLGLEPLYEGDFSADLTRGVFRAWSPVTDAPNVLEVPNLYRREDLRAAGAGDYRLLTAAVAPLPPILSASQRPALAATSADLAHVAFESRLELIAGAGALNVKLYKADGAGGVRLLAPFGSTCPAVSGAGAAAPCSAAGLGAAGLSYTRRTLSADGARAIVTSPVTAGGGVSTRAGAESRLYQVDDRGTATAADDLVLRIDASEKDPPDAPQAARFQTASADGERVFLISGEQLTAAPGGGLYRWERTPAPGAGRLTLIAPGATATIGASEDGGRVYFTALGQLVPGGPAVPEEGLYLWEDTGGGDTGTVSFIGAVATGDAAANVTSAPWNLKPSLARVTPDGRSLLFAVSDGSGLAPGRDHGSCVRNPNQTTNGRCTQVYLYRAEGSAPLAPALSCVSCPAGGGPATANAFVNAREGAGASQGTWHVSRALSDDGQRAFFSTAQPLAAGDANGKVDVYAYDAAGGAARLVSGAGDADDSWFLDASATGGDVFFVTRERLVGWDADQAYDVYDARVGGGLPEPPAPPAPCAGDGCRGAPRPPPPPVTAGSASFRGEAEARPRAKAKRCRRGLAKRRVKGKRRCARPGARRRRGR